MTKAAPRIETARLVLSAPTPSDAAAIFERYASDPEVTRYLGWPRHLSVADTEAFLKFSESEWQQRPAGPYLVRARADGRLLGSTGLAFDPADDTIAATGYVFAKDAWGQGYATEALAAMVDVAQRVGVTRLYAFCHPQHRASMHVLEKCGFVRDRTWDRQTEFPNLDPGVQQEVACYQLRPLTDELVGDFLEHVGKGHVGEVRAMLAATPQLVNAVGPHPFWGGRPQALHIAIETSRRDMFDLLLEHGADVSGANDRYGLWSPLMVAADKPEMRDELLRRGARVGLPEALLLADDGRVEELLRSGTLPDITPNDGSLLAFARTPFAIDRLLALGAPADMKDRWGSTPVDAISRLGAKARPLVEHLIARGVAAAPKEYARLGDRAALERLIETDPSIARLDPVMMGAVDFGHHALVEWLLTRGANVNARSDARSRHTALHSAAWNGDLKMVALLVEAGADRSARDEQYDATPIGWARTAIEVTNNPKCAEVVTYLAGIGG